MTGAQIVQLFEQIGSISNGDQILLQQAGGVGNKAVKVTLEVLRLYLMANFSNLEGIEEALVSLREQITTLQKSVMTNTSAISTMSGRITLMTHEIEKLKARIDKYHPEQTTEYALTNDEGKILVTDEGKIVLSTI